MKWGLRIVLVGVAVLALAGCGSTPAPASTTPGAGTANPSPTAASPAPLLSSSPAPLGDADAPADQCANDDLQVTVVQEETAMGSVYSSIVFTNTGSAECALRGVPGVSIVGNGDGTELGAPADANRDAAVETYRLAPGGAVVAGLRSVNIADHGGPIADTCPPVLQGDGYRIYPPHSFDAVFVPAAGVPACSNGTVWMSVGPVAPAA